MPEKLVRDGIVRRIQDKGEVAISREVSSPEELEIFLHAKLKEETEEFLKALSVEEAADVLEVLLAFGKLRGFTIDRVIEVMEEKRVERGGFEKGIILEIE